MSTDIVVPISTKPIKVFDDWNEVPDEYSTRNGWDYHHRTVIAGETPKAAAQLNITHDLTTVDNSWVETKLIDLFHFAQTRALKTVSRQRIARRRFHDYFIGPADKSKHIRWTKGDWVGNGDTRYWDKTIDKQGWRESKNRMTWSRTKEHLSGRELFGIFGAESSAWAGGYHYGLIDHDLHNQPLELFSLRLDVLAGHFIGKACCHFQVADELAEGVHIIVFDPASRSIKPRWLENQIRDLHKQHPECEFIKNGRLNIELYPISTNAHRLPLARNRTMLLDCPLPLVKSGKRMIHDVVGYIDWLENPSRSYMPKDEVLEFINDRLNFSCSSTASKQRDGKVDSRTTKKTKPKSEQQRSTTKMKGKTRGKIIGCWLRQEPGHFRHLNSAILTLLQAFRAEGLSEIEAVNLATEYVDNLTNMELSSRLTNPSEIHRVIQTTAAKVWSYPVNNKWARSIERWSKVGFRVSDKSTWTIANKKPEVVVDCEEIEFDEAETRLITDQLAPVLVGNKQSLKLAKRQAVINAVAYFLRYVRCCDREIKIGWLPRILRDFPINLKNHDKQTKFFKLLKEWNWIYIRVEYYHPKFYGRGGPGRARAYGIGKAMIHKFGDLSNEYPPTPYGSIFMSPIFYEDAELDRIVGNLETI